MKPKDRGFDSDPIPPDEDDPEFKEQMFLTFQESGIRPEAIREADTAKEYAEWLLKRG